MERKKKVLVVAVVLVMVAVGVLAYPLIYRYIFPLPTTMTLTLTPDRISIGEQVIMPLLSNSSTLELRHATITIERQKDSSLLFTYTQDKLLNATGCRNFPYRFWNNPPDRPAKYTEITFHSLQWSADATLLMCDDLHLYFKSYMTVTVTITETTIGT